MQQPFAGLPSDVVVKVREDERVVSLEGGIRVGGARATGVSFLLFISFFLVLTAEFASVMYEKEKQDCSTEGRPS